MKSHRILAIASLILAATAARAADADFERTFTVSGAPTVSVHTGSGYIHLYSGPPNQARIHGHVHVRDSWADADRVLKDILATPPVRQSGNTVTAEPPPHSTTGIFTDISIDYDVTAPPNSTVEAKTGSGSLEIGGIQGEVTASTGSGSIHVDNIGARAQLGTGSGNIRATALHGTASLHTGSGSIEAAVDAPGDITAHTGSGHVQLSGVQGGTRITTGSGSVSVGGNPTEEWRADTGSGGVHFQLAPGSHCNLDLHSGSGSIHVNQPVMMQGTLNRHHVTGSINGGGPTLRASTGSGSITIQ